MNSDEIKLKLQNVLAQIQTLNLELKEIDDVVSELKDKEEAYTLVSTIMVRKKKSDIIKKLDDRKEVVMLTLSRLKKVAEDLKSEYNQNAQLHKK